MQTYVAITDYGEFVKLTDGPPLKNMVRRKGLRGRKGNYEDKYNIEKVFWQF